MPDIKEILDKNKTIAMVGVSKDPKKPSTIVMKYMQEYGFKVIPVNPRAKGEKIHGEEVFEKINKIKDLNEQEEQEFKETLKYIFEILGFTFDLKEKIQISNEDLKNFFSKFQITFTSIEQAMKEYLSKREEYRENKNFDQADLMRDQLKEIGILIKDGENGGWYWENR